MWFVVARQRDMLRCDGAAAGDAGNDLSTALASFGIDGSHGWERIH